MDNSIFLYFFLVMILLMSYNKRDEGLHAKLNLLLKERNLVPDFKWLFALYGIEIDEQTYADAINLIESGEVSKARHKLKEKYNIDSINCRRLTSEIQAELRPASRSLYSGTAGLTALCIGLAIVSGLVFILILVK